MAPAESPAALLRISVAACTAPGVVHEVPLLLPAGATVAQALQMSGLWTGPLTGLGETPQDARGLHVGVWGRAARLEAPLRDLDRVELYRPLLVDPKEARRLRYRRAPKR
jgi:uncharacterized protein